MTYSEENYLKVIYHLSLNHSKGVNTNSIANVMESKPSSVTDMVQKLAEKELVIYKKYQGVSLTEKGKFTALMIVRKHRMWEVFLVETLDFSWDEVHDVAEQLEHIKSEKLINKLEEFLGFPTEDPHGDPIPDRNGKIAKIDKKLLSEINAGKKVICVGVKDSSPPFLQYLDKQQIALGSTIEVVSKEDFDLSLTLRVDDKDVTVSNKIASNLFVKTL
ncbi:metal-dependent transcriptional regulator [Flavobacterium subsaxonicum]|jgi:DtxR family Mn-dependent transcriptional regulator|uniref:Transcriptional regulator MntR n=1 Tax=Flavobacterium subsaxonicum WB 4.1-42 = DSM 21790 TaxID=1121898 RepID=A0A0A2MGG7_9FLAO|nr:metal-dependent transcriptional regulator [Flavobacterium subsaxonicum]KGO91389.1 iron-dependent repressor [Flavobacterium subsaxonicum WB 4.1-42 = DSM 21790]